MGVKSGSSEVEAIFRGFHRLEVHHTERSLIETNLFLGLLDLVFLGIIDSSRFTEGSEISANTKQGSERVGHFEPLPEPLFVSAVCGGGALFVRLFVQ